VKKNVSTGAFMRAKPGTEHWEQGVHKLLAKYQTGFGHKFRPIRTADTQSDSSG